MAGATRAEPIIPTVTGTTWEYSLKAEPPAQAKPEIVISRIAGTEELGGRNVLRLETTAGGSLVKTELVSVDEAGLHCHQRTLADGVLLRFDPPQTIAPWPLKIGAKWELDERVAGVQMHQQFTVQAQEAVAVPAGTYQAFRLHSEQPWPIGVTIDRWFAPGVGTIKDVTTTRGPNGRLLSRVTTLLLKISQTAAPLPAPTPAAAPEAAVVPSSPQITLEMAGEAEGEARTEFRSDAPNIFVRWKGETLPVDSVIRLAWVAEDVGDVATPNFIVDETEVTATRPELSGRLRLSSPRDGWAAGKYRVDAYLNDELVQSLKVTIRD